MVKTWFQTLGVFYDIIYSWLIKQKTSGFRGFERIWLTDWQPNQKTPQMSLHFDHCTFLVHGNTWNHLFPNSSRWEELRQTRKYKKWSLIEKQNWHFIDNRMLGFCCPMLCTLIQPTSLTFCRWLIKRTNYVFKLKIQTQYYIFFFRRLFFVIEYVNGGDLMFHMQRQRKLPEEHAR